MLLRSMKKSLVFVGAMAVASLTVLVATFMSGGSNIHADDPLTTTITIEKIWSNDDIQDRPDSITAYIKRDSTTLRSGIELNVMMKQLSNSGTSTNSFNTTVQAIKIATNAEYEAKESSLTANNEIQASGKKAYMWYEDSNNTIYIYSDAGKIYAPSDLGSFAKRMTNLVDISGMAVFDTTYVTTIDRMFQDSVNIADLSPLTNWNTSNVRNMDFAFGGNTSTVDSVTYCQSGGQSTQMQVTDLTPLANWDVSNVTSMSQMFKCAIGLSSLAPLANWNVKNVTVMRLMFANTSVSTIVPIEDWSVVRVTDFSNMFAKTSITDYDQEFTMRSPGSIVSAGSNDGGSYATSTAAIETPDPVTTKTDTGDELSCSSWTKDDANNRWTCTITVSNDGANYVAWESKVPGYISSATAENPVAVVNGGVAINNALDLTADHFIRLKKVVVDDAADPNQQFLFDVTVYDENGVEIVSHRETVNMQNGQTKILFALPDGYSYRISEAATSYSVTYEITDTDTGSVLGQASSTDTGNITPAEDQTVIFTNTKTHNPTKVITVTKRWEEDIPSIRSQPADVTVTVKKTVSYLPAGTSLKTTMTNLAGAASAIKAIKKVDTSECASAKLSNATTISTSGDPTYMWWNSSEGAIYMCSEADNVYANANMLRAFSELPNLEDISGLALLNTSYVTNMGLMFQNDVKIADLSPLANWDTTNVTSMRFMFGSTNTAMRASYSDLSPLAGWNTGNVIDMNQMFKGCGYVTSVDALSRWDVRNVADMNQMFNRIGIDVPGATISVSGLANWNPARVGSSYVSAADNTTKTGNFDMMFANAGLSNSSLPVFSSRPGSWSGNASYSPSGRPASSPYNVPTKVDNTPTVQTCTGSGGGDGVWNTTLDANGVWTCTLTVSNDGAIYTVWESPISYYDSSATQTNPIVLSSNSANVTNTRQTYMITAKKYITGNLAQISKEFDYAVKVYNGDTEVGYYNKTFTLGQADDFGFKVPAGFSYQITETNDGYDASYKIENTADGAIIQTQTTGAATSKITPASNQTVIFTNNKEKAPNTGIMDNGNAYEMMVGLVVGSLLVLLVAYRADKYIKKVRDG